MIENDKLAVKAMLKSVSNKILEHFAFEKVSQSDLLSYEVSIAQILSCSLHQRVILRHKVELSFSFFQWNAGYMAILHCYHFPKITLK